MKIAFNKLNTFSVKIKKIPWIFASHAFLMILFFILISLIIGVLVFYKYVILTEVKQQDIIEKNIKFRYNVYNEILNRWQVKNLDLEASKNKQYLNPFTAILENSSE